MLDKKDIRTTGVRNADELKQRYRLGHDYKEEIEASEKKLMASLEEKTGELKDLAFESAPLSVGKGGTGAVSFPEDSFLLGSGTSALQTKTADEALTLIGAQKKPVLLWENASPNSSFANQVVALPNSSDYAFFLVEIKCAYNVVYSHTTAVDNTVGYNEYLLAMNSDDWTAFRHVVVVSSGLDFGGGGYIYYGEYNTAVSNRYGIPLKIWGV